MSGKTPVSLLVLEDLVVNLDEVKVVVPRVERTSQVKYEPIDPMRPIPPSSFRTDGLRETYVTKNVGTSFIMRDGSTQDTKVDFEEVKKEIKLLTEPL